MIALLLAAALLHRSPATPPAIPTTEPPASFLNSCFLSTNRPVRVVEIVRAMAQQGAKVRWDRESEGSYILRLRTKDEMTEKEHAFSLLLATAPADDSYCEYKNTGMVLIESIAIDGRMGNQADIIKAGLQLLVQVDPLATPANHSDDPRFACGIPSIDCRFNDPNFQPRR